MSASLVLVTDDEDTWRRGKPPASHWDDDRRATDGDAFRSRPPRVQSRPQEHPVVAQPDPVANLDEITLPHDLFDEPHPEERSRRDSDAPVTGHVLRRAIRHVFDQQHRSDQRRHAELLELLDRPPRDAADEIRGRLAKLEDVEAVRVKRSKWALGVAASAALAVAGGIYALGRKAERFDALEQTVREVVRDLRELGRRSSTTPASQDALATTKATRRP